jgi:ubiquitin carboxyl-terminal hydrolase 4/11/15
MMKSMWMGRNSSVSAWDLKKVISKFAPQFYGYGQQDSQELLSYVLDGLHEDLNKVLSKPIVEDIKLRDESDEQAATLFWQSYRKRNDSYVNDLVAGQFKSTLVCPRCRTISRTFDPFMTISLPIPSYTQLPISMYVI